jgi:type II secretory pathway pseudopilin PulG
MGFSLIETVVATGIIATVALGVAQLFAVTADLNRRAAMQTSMTLLAVQKMEELRSTGTGGTDGTDHLDSGGGIVPAAGAAYVRRWTIEPLAASPGRLLLIRVSVVSASQLVEARIIGVRRRAP